MLLQYSTAASLLALCSLSNAYALKHKRDSSEVALYAYGSEADGAPVFYDNGKLLNFPHMSPTHSNNRACLYRLGSPRLGHSNKHYFHH